MGRNTTASDYGSLVIGQYNSSGSVITTSSTTFNTSNTAFVIGNGTLGNLSDAFKVMFNGDTSVSNNLTVMGDLEVQSDARLKSNIVSLGPTLSKLLQIDGKSYEMKGKKKIGVLAQEIHDDCNGQSCIQNTQAVILKAKNEGRPSLKIWGEKNGFGARTYQ